MKKIFSFSFAVIFSFSVHAQDTFSICAVDTLTGEVGSAGASCLDDDDIEGGVLIISDVHPGVGVVHTQSYWRPANQTYAQQLMTDGLSPQQIIDSLVANDDQNNPSIRQYGVVDLSGDTARSAAFTGENCFDYKNHILGPNYAIQGNILLGQEILDSMEYRFLHTEGELACKLMAALQGAKVIGADTRCAPAGVSSLSAFVRVAQPGDSADSLYLDLLVPKVLEGVDPIDSLQTLVDQWGGCTTTGIPEAADKTCLRVYPNPAAGQVHFELDAVQLNVRTVLVVFDARGQLVYQNSDVKSTTLSWETSSFPRGIYFYRMQQEGNTLAGGKIILE
ncbi:MAG: DUF1028 domain-containing protein [Bacteroidales bacterium]|nr:DUF1028 domain-containing protein [Bacteroidales bacterium]